MRVLLLTSLLVVAAGCSNKSIYEGIQINQRSQCLEEQGDKYFDCVEKTEKSYEEYKEELDDLQSD